MLMTLSSSHPAFLETSYLILINSNSLHCLPFQTGRLPIFSHLIHPRLISRSSASHSNYLKSILHHYASNLFSVSFFVHMHAVLASSSTPLFPSTNTLQTFQHMPLPRNLRCIYNTLAHNTAITIANSLIHSRWLLQLTLRLFVLPASTLPTPARTKRFSQSCVTPYYLIFASSLFFFLSISIKANNEFNWN